MAGVDRTWPCDLWEGRIIKAHPGRPVIKDRGLWGREGAQSSDSVLGRKG